MSSLLDWEKWLHPPACHAGVAGSIPAEVASVEHIDLFYKMSSLLDKRNVVDSSSTGRARSKDRMLS